VFIDERDGVTMRLASELREQLLDRQAKRRFEARIGYCPETTVQVISIRFSELASQQSVHCRAIQESEASQYGMFVRSSQQRKASRHEAIRPSSRNRPK
jgi:hypothetical protein